MQSVSQAHASERGSMSQTPAEERRLKKQVGIIQAVLGKFIAWTAQSAGSPISVSDAQMLLKDLDRCNDD